MVKHDPIIDRSPEQKQIRVDKLTAELLSLGYSVFKTDALRKFIADTRQGAKYEVIA